MTNCYNCTINITYINWTNYTFVASNYYTRGDIDGLFNNYYTRGDIEQKLNLMEDNMNILNNNLNLANNSTRTDNWKFKDSVMSLGIVLAIILSVLCFMMMRGGME
jgi:hypothetical protein